MLDDEKRAYVIERFAGRGSGTLTVSAENGRRVEPATLQRMLGHASVLLFKNVFAFDLDQLRDVTALQEAGVTDSIYSAGVGAAGLTQALTQFDASRRKIYLPNGRKQPVAQALNALASVEEKLAASAEAASQYSKLQAERETTERALAAADAARARAQQESIRAERLHEAWSDWVTLRELERELEQIPPRPEFPSDATTRLENAEASLGRSQYGWRENGRSWRVVAAPLLRSVRREATGGCGGDRNAPPQRDTFAVSLDDLPKLSRGNAGLEQEVAQDIRTLGRAWNADRVERFGHVGTRAQGAGGGRRGYNAALQSRRDGEIACESVDRRLRDELVRLEAAREALHELPAPILVSTRWEPAASR